MVHTKAASDVNLLSLYLIRGMDHSEESHKGETELTGFDDRKKLFHVIPTGRQTWIQDQEYQSIFLANLSLISLVASTMGHPHSDVQTLTKGYYTKKSVFRSMHMNPRQRAVVEGQGTGCLRS